MEEDFYIKCKWCNWYKEGKCLNQEKIKGKADIYRIFENGYAREALEEINLNNYFQDLTLNILNSKLSKKEQNRIIKEFQEEVKDEIEDLISEVVLGVLKDNLLIDVTIKDPDNFYCKYFS